MNMKDFGEGPYTYNISYILSMFAEVTIFFIWSKKLIFYKIFLKKF